MNCAFCNQAIDDDSLFCDQCGQQILICPTCGKPGSKKRCIHDGAALVPAQELSASSGAGGTMSGAAPVGPGTAPPAGAAGSTPVPPAGPWGASPAPAGAPAAGGPAAVGGPAAASLQLVNGNLGLSLEIKPHTMIGRKVGEFAPVFAQHSSVSSRHAQFTTDASGTWYVTDLGSTNGTFYGDTQLAPNQPTPLSDGTFLTIANIEFFVQITGNTDDDAEGGTMRL